VSSSGPAPLFTLTRDFLPDLSRYAATVAVKSHFTPAGVAAAREDGHAYSPETLFEAVARGGGTAGQKALPAIMPDVPSAGHSSSGQCSHPRYRGANPMITSELVRAQKQTAC
jgi:hypothetical protein